MASQMPNYEQTDERPTEVPDHFVAVPADDGGYAVHEGALWVALHETNEGEEYGDEFMLDLAPGSARDAADMAIIVTRACKFHDDTPSAVSKCVEGGSFRGDLSDLKAVVDALNYYEKNEAGIGEDKATYELRTAFNHSRSAVQKRIAPDANLH